MDIKEEDWKIGSGASVDEELPQELDKPVTKKFEWRKVWARFKDNNWAADLAEMGSLLSKTQGVKFHKICMGYNFQI